MINIYKEIIKNYITRLSKEDLKVFAYKNSITYTEEELDIIYSFILNNYNDLLNENIKVFEKIKNRINPNLYKRLLNLYIEYKQKYL